MCGIVPYKQYKYISIPLFDRKPSSCLSQTLPRIFAHKGTHARVHMYIIYQGRDKFIIPMCGVMIRPRPSNVGKKKAAVE